MLNFFKKNNALKVSQWIGISFFVGRLSNLTTLKVDDNQLTSLPFSVGGWVEQDTYMYDWLNYALVSNTATHDKDGEKSSLFAVHCWK